MAEKGDRTNRMKKEVIEVHAWQMELLDKLETKGLLTDFQEVYSDMKIKVVQKLGDKRRYINIHGVDTEVDHVKVSSVLNFRF